MALANSQMNLNKAYANFFCDKFVGFSKFKSKKDNHRSYTTNNQKGPLLISGVQHQPKEIFHQTRLYERIGEQYFFTRSGLAIHFALQK